MAYQNVALKCLIKNVLSKFFILYFLYVQPSSINVYLLYFLYFFHHQSSVNEYFMYFCTSFNHPSSIINHPSIYTFSKAVKMVKKKKWLKMVLNGLKRSQMVKKQLRNGLNRSKAVTFFFNG